MNCPNCAKQISDTAKVCGYCGTRLTRQEPAPPPEPAPIVEKSSQPPIAPEPVVEPEPPVVEEVPEPAPRELEIPDFVRKIELEPEPEPAAPSPVEPAPEKSEPAAPTPAKPRKGLPGWAWAMIGVVVILIAVFVGTGQRPAPTKPAAATKPPAPTKPAAAEKPAPTSVPQEAEVEEAYQLVRQYADDWYGADLVQEYDFDDFSFWAEEEEEVLVYASNYEELDGYIRLIGDGSWMTWFCDHHYQPGHASVSVFTLEEDSNFSIGYLTPWANYGEEDYLWWGMSGPEGEAGTVQVDEVDNIHFLGALEPELTYWLLLANEGSDFLIQLGDVGEDIVLGETILPMDPSWNLDEWKYCVSVGSGVVDLHYYGVRSFID